MIPDIQGSAQEQDPVTLFHNPRCSTSRKALELLREAGHEPGVVEYLETGWTREQLEQILEQMEAKPADIFRHKEPLARDLGLTQPGVTDEELLEAMVVHPVLVERPIATRAGKARLGRPAEKVLDLI